MARNRWADLSDRRLNRRLGKMLGVRFDAKPVGRLGGSLGALAEVGDHAWVAVQVEHKHTHPAENVLQYWPWLERSRRRLVLVHVIAPDARKRTGSRTDLTIWIGAMMERVLPGRFTYCRLELGTSQEIAQLCAAIGAIAVARSPMEGRMLVQVS